MNTQNRIAESESQTLSFSRVCLASSQELAAQIQAAKDAVVAEVRELGRGHERLLQLALTEAEALAWDTGFPQLFFPALAQEKARSVAAWSQRQQWIRNEPVLAFAA